MSIFRYRVPLLGLTAGVLFAASSRQLTTVASMRPIQQYIPRHTTWPYSASDFERSDPSSDGRFYADARLVTHIDDRAIASLREYYSVLPKQGKILDFCSSWISHYPQTIEDAASKGDLAVTGMGMNKAELDANDVLKNRILVDLNEHPNIADALLNAGVVGPSESEKLDAATCVVSIDYLTKPVEVLTSLKSVIKTGGKVHLTISNRCFPTKAVARWLRISEGERLLMVGDYLHFAGWKEIEIVELSNGIVDAEQQQERSPQNSLQGLMHMLGMNSRDPLWVVRAVNQ